MSQFYKGFLSSGGCYNGVKFFYLLELFDTLTKKYSYSANFAFFVIVALISTFEFIADFLKHFLNICFYSQSIDIFVMSAYV